VFLNFVHRMYHKYIIDIINNLLMYINIIRDITYINKYKYINKYHVNIIDISFLFWRYNFNDHSSVIRHHRTILRTDATVR